LLGQKAQEQQKMIGGSKVQRGKRQWARSPMGQREFSRQKAQELATEAVWAESPAVSKDSCGLEGPAGEEALGSAWAKILGTVRDNWDSEGSVKTEAIGKSPNCDVLTSLLAMPASGASGTPTIASRVG
jgi:hypothetical protein